MTRCPQCRHENPDDATFCLECGGRLALQCNRCGTEIPAGAKFCKACGQAVGTAGRPVAARAGHSPQSYTPKHLVDRILTTRAALEGERKQITVLFADLKGSMELLAERDPEEARRLLDPVLEYMMEAVHHYEGTVNQVMGDGIMALFGAPLAHEDHAVRACYAALRMQETVKRYAEALRRTEGVLVQIRVGLNSGEVVVRSVRSDLRTDYTAVGQTTHLAARMEQLAAPGTILLAPHTLALTEGFVQVTSLGPAAVKGLREPVEIYELVGAAPVRSRLHAAAARGLTRFVGREREIDELRRAQEKAHAGHGQVVAVVGEPGVGKSRLFWEFVHSHHCHGWLLLESGAASYEKVTAFASVIGLLEAYFHVEGREETRTIREKVTGKLLALDRALEPSLSALLAMLDVGMEDDAWVQLDPPQRRQRTLDAMKRLLLRESQVQPVVLLFEDLQWIDTESQAALDALVDSLPTARLLLLVSYRPEYQHGWGAKSHYQQLRVDPLPAETADGLLTSLLGTDESLDSVKRTLIERTAGNPLFLEESVRILEQAHALVGERGAYRLEQDAPGIQLPPTVQAILAARIDRLAAADKSLLQAAAVIGPDVPFALLRAIADLGEDDVRRGLTHLQAAEFLHEARLFPDLEYAFKHPMTHAVAYGGLLQERRRALHARIVDAIETLYPDRLGEHGDRLAHHAVQGEAWPRAVGYLRQAGRRAIGQSAYQRGVACFEQAREVVARLPPSRDTMEQAIDVRLELRALVHLGQYERILDYMREAETLARELGDTRRLGTVLADLCARLRNVGEHDRAIATGRQALAVATELADLDLEEEASYRAGQAHFAVGDFAGAVELLRQSLDVDRRRATARSGLPRFYRAWSHGWLALTCATLGQFAEAVTYGTEAVRLAGSADHAFSVAEARSALGGVHLERGDVERATALFEASLTLTRSLGITLPNVLSGLGYAYHLAGRLAEAQVLLASAVEERTLISSMGVGHAVHVARRAEACLAAGQVQPAVESARRALDLARTHKERGNEASALRVLGEIASRRDRPDAAIAAGHYVDALALARTLGMRPLAARCHLGLARSYRLTGSEEQAEAHLATARSMCRDMGMTFWLNRAEAEPARSR